MKKLNKGTIVADAAIVLPIFVLSLALIINCILQCAYEAKLYKDLCEDSVLISTFESSSDSIGDYKVISGITQKYNVVLSVYYRPFLGYVDDESSDYTNVYVYTKRGSKYHYSGCSTMDYNMAYTVMTKAKAIELGFTECRLCCAGGKDYFKK